MKNPNLNFDFKSSEALVKNKDLYLVIKELYKSREEKFVQKFLDLDKEILNEINDLNYSYKEDIKNIFKSLRKFKKKSSDVCEKTIKKDDEFEQSLDFYEKEYMEDIIKLLKEIQNKKDDESAFYQEEHRFSINSVDEIKIKFRFVSKNIPGK
jgi:hypothetical protein